MNAWSALFGLSEGEKRARQARIEAEDRLMTVLPHERKNLPDFADGQNNRNLVLIARIRDSAAVQNAKSDRNLWATVAVGVLMILKGVVSFADIGKILVGIFKVFAGG